MKAQLIACLLLGTGLSAQNLITNGDFSAGLTGWSQGGTSCTPAIETFNVTGLGASQCYGVSPSSSLPQYLEQAVQLAPSTVYEFSADVSTILSRVGYYDVDAGSLSVEVNARQVGSFVFSGTITAPRTWRGRATIRFSTTSSGSVLVRIYLRRGYLCNTFSPRMNIDNISLRAPTGPTFAITDARRVPNSMPMTLSGTSNALAAVCIAGKELQPGLHIPGFSGLLHLDPISLSPLFGTQLDANGRCSIAILIPTVTILLTQPLYFQPVEVPSGAPALGFHQAGVFTTN